MRGIFTEPVTATTLQLTARSNFQYTRYVDPSLSIVIVIIIVVSTLPLLKESSLVLMQTVPDNYEISELRESLLTAVPEIIDIHEVRAK